MKVFLSSAIAGFEVFREAAAGAVQALGYEVTRSEDFPASTKSPQIACLEGVREADLVLVILGERYGAAQPSGKSATHEEYEEAKGKKPVLLFVQENVAMESAQEAFRRELERWQGGNFAKTFASPEQLRERVTAAVHQHSVKLARGGVDEKDMVQRAEALMTRSMRAGSPALAVAIACGPKQQILRPKQMGDPSLEKRIHKEARFGEHAIFDERAEARSGIQDDALVITQRERLVLIDELGSMLLQLPVRSGELRGLGWLVEEMLTEQAEKALRFAIQLLGEVDQTERLSRVAVMAGLLDAGYMGWKTMEEYRQQPGSGTMGMGSEKVVVALRPPMRSREQLRNDSKSIAEDLVHLLRRAHTPRRG